MLNSETRDMAVRLVDLCRKEGRTVVTVESCTGGLLSAALTSMAGSSDVFERGYVTYSNEAKTSAVLVRAEQIAYAGAVSEDVAWAMAEGAIRKSGADIAVSITGVAGPGGGTEEKPVGLVHFATCRWDGKIAVHHEVFPGDRGKIREAAVRQAMKMVEEALYASPGD
jgi:nicotinamide-nucleotide amidase